MIVAFVRLFFILILTGFICCKIISNRSLKGNYCLINIPHTSSNLFRFEHIWFKFSWEHCMMGNIDRAREMSQNMKIV